MPLIEALDLFEARHALDAPTGGLAKRTLTSESTLAQLGGGSGYMGFNAAKYGRLTSDWPSASRSADQDLVIDLRRLRSRARFQAINSPIAAKFLGMVRANVIGPHGVKLAFKVPKQRKTKNGGFDDDVNKELAAKWHEWGKKGSCTVCGRYSWRELQRLVIENVARDGEQILRKVYVPKTVNPFGFQLQLIDADQLDDTYNQLGRWNANEIRMGVEVDANQKPIAYYLFKGNPYEVSIGSADRVRVPADQIIHFYVAHRTGQTRGYPWFAASMSQLNMLDGYFFAELTSARISSSLLASLESTTAPEYQGDGLNSDGSKAFDIGAGKLLELPPNTSLKNNTPEHPTTAFENFVKQSNRLIASGCNVAYHKLCNDLAGINYSSGRLGELEEREFWMEMQAHFIDDVAEEVYDTWQRISQLNGALDLPFDLKRYTGPSLKWDPRRWDWVDPLKDMQSNVLEIQNGANSHQRQLAERGLDWREVFEEIKEAQDYADELGIALGTDIRGQGTSEINAEDETAESGGEPQNDEEKPAAEQPKKPGKPKAGTKPAPAKPKP